MYTVKQMATLAQVSIRTLHYYDEIDLLKPSSIGRNHYRYYDDDALLRLQQILLYRELGLELGQIKSILDDPTFDAIQALRHHRTQILSKIDRLHTLVETVDTTMMHIAGENIMNKKRLFVGFSEEQQKQYEREVRLEYGPDIVNDAVKRWGDYTDAEKEAIKQKGDAIYQDLVRAIEAQVPANSGAVQAIMVRWHQHIRYFYEPTLEIMQGLGDLYNAHPDFIANFAVLHPELAAYTREAITFYVDDLETEMIRQMLAEEKQQSS